MNVTGIPDVTVANGAAGVDGGTGVDGATVGGHSSVDGVTIAGSSDVDERASIGAGTRVWHLAQIREHATVGRNCNIGRGAYLGPGVVVGDNVKVHNYALVFEPARLADGVFIGPAAVLTNDQYPRAVTPDGRLKTGDDWTMVGVEVGEGAAISARAVCVAPVTIGRWAMVGAGAVVTRDVPDFALVVGAPARQIGWVGRAGARLTPAGDNRFACPQTGAEYAEINGTLTESGPADGTS